MTIITSPHPYNPKNLILPHYVPNDKSLVEILAVFFGFIAVFIIGTWIYSGKVSYTRRCILTRSKMCWFMVCGLIHIILEGYFGVFHSTLAGGHGFFDQIWKEYSMGDSRYVSSDTFTVCMETITACVDGPLAFLALYAFFTNKPYRHAVQLILSLCQLYGDVLYFTTEIKDGFIHGEMYHPIYFWFYFVFLNMLWIVVPMTLIVDSYRRITVTQAVVDKIKATDQKKKSK